MNLRHNGWKPLNLARVSESVRRQSAAENNKHLTNINEKMTLLKRWDLLLSKKEKRWRN